MALANVENILFEGSKEVTNEVTNEVTYEVRGLRGYVDCSD